MKIHFKRLDHIQICIPMGMEDEARKFYHGILGLEEIEKPGSLKPNGGLWYKIADVQLHIGVEKIEGKSKRHPAFEIEDTDAVKKYLIENGIRVKEETKVPGQKRFSFLDPFDNRVELLEKSEHG
jgi:catechol 2,3-dioxygenase-like lactoylglutathione lyase family enzyme